MKTRLVTITVIAAISITVLIVGLTVSNTNQKHQYKFWQKNMEFENNNYYLRVLFSRSNDYGKTFSDPVDMSMTDLNAHEPKMIVMNDDVILVWRDEVKDKQSSILSFARSTDFGDTFEKKRLFYGARPDIKYYGNTLYLTFVDVDLRQILYSKSDDGGQTFSEPEMIFKVDWDLSPYDERPMPTLDVDADKMAIIWKMNDKNEQYAVWKATDYGKDGGFEVTSSLTQRD